ncbi:hypothetical protein QFZ75_000469 [Streptomyces sp. V3I8]|nr:hypothetical protein [Streptomyces sp. V3I8]
MTTRAPAHGEPRPEADPPQRADRPAGSCGAGVRVPTRVPNPADRIGPVRDPIRHVATPFAWRRLGA